MRLQHVHSYHNNQPTEGERQRLEAIRAIAARNQFSPAIGEMSTEKEPFVPTNNLKPYEITVPPPTDYNKGEREHILVQKEGIETYEQIHMPRHMKCPN